TTLFPDEACDVGDRRGGRSRQRARQRIEDVGLDSLDNRGVEPRGIDGRRKTRQIDHQIGCCDVYVTGGYSGLRHAFLLLVLWAPAQCSRWQVLFPQPSPGAVRSPRAVSSTAAAMCRRAAAAVP